MRPRTRSPGGRPRRLWSGRAKKARTDEVGAVTLFMPEDFSNRIFERLTLGRNMMQPFIDAFLYNRRVEQFMHPKALPIAVRNTSAPFVGLEQANSNENQASWVPQPPETETGLAASQAPE